MRNGAIYGRAANRAGSGVCRPQSRLVVIALFSLLLCLKSLSIVAPHAERGHGLTTIGGWSTLFDDYCGSGDERPSHAAGDSCCLASVDAIGSGREPSTARTVSVSSPRRAPLGRHEAPRRFLAGWASAWSAQSPPVTN